MKKEILCKMCGAAIMMISLISISEIIPEFCDNCRKEKIIHNLEEMPNLSNYNYLVSSSQSSTASAYSYNPLNFNI